MYMYMYIYIYIHTYHTVPYHSIPYHAIHIYIYIIIHLYVCMCVTYTGDIPTYRPWIKFRNHPSGCYGVCQPKAGFAITLPALVALGFNTSGAALGKRLGWLSSLKHQQIWIKSKFVICADPLGIPLEMKKACVWKDSVHVGCWRDLWHASS